MMDWGGDSDTNRGRVGRGKDGGEMKRGVEEGEAERDQRAPKERHEKKVTWKSISLS